MPLLAVSFFIKKDAPEETIPRFHRSDEIEGGDEMVCKKDARHQGRASVLAYEEVVVVRFVAFISAQIVAQGVGPNLRSPRDFSSCLSPLGNSMFYSGFGHVVEEFVPFSFDCFFALDKARVERVEGGARDIDSSINCLHVRIPIFHI